MIAGEHKIRKGIISVLTKVIDNMNVTLFKALATTESENRMPADTSVEHQICGLFQPRKRGHHRSTFPQYSL